MYALRTQRQCTYNGAITTQSDRARAAEVCCFPFSETQSLAIRQCHSTTYKHTDNARRSYECAHDAFLRIPINRFGIELLLQYRKQPICCSSSKQLMASIAPPLSFYTCAPAHALELDDVERLGLLRLQVLCALSSPRTTDRALAHHAVDSLDAFQELFAFAAPSDPNDACSTRDTTSHYALRLAFCKCVSCFFVSLRRCCCTTRPNSATESSCTRTLPQCSSSATDNEWIATSAPLTRAHVCVYGTCGSIDRTRELIDWLVDAETALFRFRLHRRAPHAAVDVLAREGVVYASSRSSEATVSNQSKSDSSHAIVYHVPFPDAHRLVQRRSVRMRRGLCLVPLERMHVVAQHHFRTALTQQLCVLQRALPANADAVDALARLDATLARFVAHAHVHQRHRTSVPHRPLAITAATIDALAPTHFPLCMRQLHRKFREHHHLKYDGRLQYCMFLKGLGWSVHDTLVHFRAEFVRVLAPATFDKAYAYAIRHSYGLEGGRKDYAPFDCAQIRHGAAPRHGQYHGCPFHHWDAVHVVRELEASGVASEAAVAIAHVAAAGDAQGACQRFFDASHARSYADVVRTSVVTTIQQQRQLRGSPSNRRASASRQSQQSDPQDDGPQQQLATHAVARVSHPNAWVDASLQSR